MEHQDILDHNITPPPINNAYQQDDRLDPQFYTASSGLRFANYLIDGIIKAVIDEIIFLLLGISQFEDSTYGAGSELEHLVPRLAVGLMTLFLYYGVLEGTTGRTIGKLITGTIVVNREGQRISWGQAMGRTACRMIPFEVFSFLGSRAIGWHDSIPGTYVVNRYYATIRTQEGNPIVY